MKNLFCSLLLLISLFFSACDKEKFDPLGDNGNPTSYVLKSITFSVSSVKMDAYFFTYNDDHLLSEVSRCTSTFYSLEDSSSAFRDTVHYRFTYLNKYYAKFQAYSSQSAGNGSYWIYEFDNQHKVKKQIFYDNKNVEQWRKSYEYENGHVTKETSSKDKDVFSICTMEYNSNNNLTGLTYYDLSTPQKKSRREYLSFDNHVNYTRAINGSPIIFSWSYLMPGYSNSSPNNYIERNTYATVGIDEPFDKPVKSGIYTEEYNDEGLPLIQKSAGDLTITYEYEKYR